MTAATKDAEPEVAELPPPTNVIAAISRVMAEIGGIKKLTPQQRERLGMGGGEKGITYAYRGIDQLAQAAQPLFGTYGVVIVPNVLDTKVIPVSKGGASLETTLWTRTTVEVEWTIYGPGGMDDKIISITVGVGDDGVDKGHNKAMTASFKNLLLRILCIGDPQDDSDGHGGNEQPDPIDPRPEVPFGKTLFDEIKASGDDRLKALLRQFAVDNGKSLKESELVKDEEWAKEVSAAISKHRMVQEQDAAADVSQVEPESADMAAAMGKTLPHHEGGDEPKAKLGGAAKRKKDEPIPEEQVADAVAEAFPGSEEVTG